MPQNDLAPAALSSPFRLSANAQVGASLASLGRYVTAAYRRALDPTGLAARHVRTLRRLGRGPVTQRELAAELGVDAASLVGILNELEREGLVERRRDPRDRRRHNVSISALGEARLAGVESAVAAVENQLLAGLDAVQRTYLAQGLEDMARRVGLRTGADLDSPAEP